MPVLPDLLRRAYQEEIESVASYLALSVTLDGVKAHEVKEVLAEDVDEELGHAKRLAARLKEIGERPPGSLELEFRMTGLQPPARTTDVVGVVRGVLAAEEDAIRTYREIILTSRDEDDPVTEDLAIQLLADEEKHRTLFRGFLMEYEQGMPAGAAGATAAAGRT